MLNYVQTDHPKPTEALMRKLRLTQTRLGDDRYQIENQQPRAFGALAVAIRHHA